MDDNAALVVIDVQQGFDDPYWGEPDNPDCLPNIGRLLAAWTAAHRPIVLVRHDSREPGSPLRPGAPGNAFAAELRDVPADLVFGKHVNSAFHGEVDLDGWLRGRGIGELVLCGIQTNMCVETTARVAGNLGYRVRFVLDATRTFALTGPDGRTLTAAELSAATAVNLHGGGFAEVLGTADVLS